MIGKVADVIRPYVVCIEELMEYFLYLQLEAEENSKTSLTMKIYA